MSNYTHCNSRATFRVAVPSGETPTSAVRLTMDTGLGSSREVIGIEEGSGDLIVEYTSRCNRMQREGDQCLGTCALAALIAYNVEANSIRVEGECALPPASKA